MLEKLTIGQIFEAGRVFSQEDFDRFATLSGDDNPIHVDPVFAAQTRFGRPVCHGMLLYSTICGALHAMLPGASFVQLEQSLMFPTPTYAGESVTLCLEMLDAQPALQTARISTTITRPSGETACQGETVIRAGASWPHGQPASASKETVLDGSISEPEEMRGLRLGQQAAASRAFSAADLDEYVALSGDSDPLISDLDAAKRAGLRGRIVPAGLLGGLFSQLLGTKLPGQGTNWLKQNFTFQNPAYVDEKILATVAISRLRPEKDLVNLHTTCATTAGEIICTGEALVFVRDIEDSSLRNSSHRPGADPGKEGGENVTLACQE